MQHGIPHDHTHAQTHNTQPDNLSGPPPRPELSSRHGRSASRGCLDTRRAATRHNPSHIPQGATQIKEAANPVNIPPKTLRTTRKELGRSVSRRIPPPQERQPKALTTPTDIEACKPNSYMTPRCESAYTSALESEGRCLHTQSTSMR